MNIRLMRHILMLVLAIYSCAVHAETQGAARIVSLQGKGEYREAAEPKWREAVVRQQLVEGNYVRTADQSRMAVLLADQSQIRLASNSMIQIKQVGDNRDIGTVIKQSAGRTWTQSKNVPNKLTVETPSALAAIRGTDWELEVAEDGTSTLTVLSGEVQLSNEQGSVSIAAGEQAEARIGVAPVKRILRNPRDRVQWVSSFTADPKRYPELGGANKAIPAAESAALKALGDLLRSGDLAAARAAAGRLAAQQPATGTAHLLLSDFQVIDGEIEPAIAALRQGAARYPGDERFDVWRARLHLLRDEIAEARAALASAKAKNPNSTEALIAEGELERFEGDARAATTAYRSALAASPDSARAWHGLGVIQSEREDVSNARASLGRALEIDPQGAGFLGELGTLEAFADDLVAARAAFTRAIEERADDYVALTGLGLVELKAGNTAEAITRLLAATLIEPRYARAQTYLAIAYYQQARIRDTLFALSRARELDPKDPLPDMLESVIHNDLLQPGDALESARRALALLPYLKSANQIANDQKGSANLGSALAAFSLEDWARAYAQDSYYPFWAGSHLFLADRYSGKFNKKTEQIQGFLSDPTVFGASNRFSTLIPRPGNYGSVSHLHGSSRNTRIGDTLLTANGYANSAFPVAYFAEANRRDDQTDSVAYDAGSNTYTLAFGARPTYELGLFAYANALDADVTAAPSTLSGTTRMRIKGREERVELGAHYRFTPQSQAWLKLGNGSEDSSTSLITTVTTPFGPLSNSMDWQVRPDQHDLQFRHTFAADENHEFSWGAEFAQLDKLSNLVRESLVYIGSDSLSINDRDRSHDIWLSDRFQVNDRLKLQGDLAFHHYTKTSDIDTLFGSVPPVSQALTENFDRSIVAPRLGATYAFGNGATLRGALQKWLRPAAYNTLAPVATAGIPVDDSLVSPGGTLSRLRIQLDSELSLSRFITVFADHKLVDNLSSRVLNSGDDTSNFNRLNQSGVANLADPDRLEATPVFTRGTVSGGGATFNQILSRQLAGYLGYAYTTSENTSATQQGKDIPYLPRHRAILGLTWAGGWHTIASAQAVWRSQRYTDEANQSAWPAGWDMILKLHWESDNKCWNVEGYAVNLLKRDADDLFGIKLIARF